MQLAGKIEAEASADTINQQRKSADAELRAAAGICGLTAENDAEIVNRLQEWLKECDRQNLFREELGHQALVRLAWNERQLEQRELLRKSNLPFAAAALRRIAESWIRLTWRKRPMSSGRRLSPSLPRIATAPRI